MASRTFFSVLVFLALLTFVSFSNAFKFCDTECSKRKNIILILGRGGINERLFLYSKMSGVANYLCAHLVIPSPYEALAARYNRYKFVSRNITWRDFVVMQTPKHHCGEDTNDVIQSDAETSGLVMVNNVSTAVSFKTQGISFVWELHDELFRTATANLLWNITTYVQNDILSRHPQSSSSGIGWQLSDLDVTFGMSPLMLHHSERIMTSNKFTAHEFIVFHVRRGDLKHLCNTDPEAISKALEYALGNCPFFISNSNGNTKALSAHVSRMPVLLFSDEGSFIYRSEVRHEIREFGFENVIDGDYLIQEYVQSELSDIYMNNYVTYRIATAIQMQTDKLIQIHGHHGCGNRKMCD